MKTNNPRNEGRVFRAWCGPEYMFILGDDKRLHTKLYFDPWVNYQLLEESLLAVWREDPYAETTREMRLEEKALRFRDIYGQVPNPKLPAIPERTARIMTVKAPPIVDPPIDYMGWDD